MANQFQLFKKRKFSAMFFTQFLGAFNDNVFKQALILVLTYSAAAKMGLKDASLLNNLAALLFILPYFLFSSLAGQLADKYEKSMLTRHLKLLEIFIMAAATIGFVFELYWFLFLALFLMGAQSTFFGPIKYAYLPEVMADDELVGANGLFQMGTSLAILTGMMFAGILTQLDNALIWTSVTVLIVASLGYLVSRFLPKTFEFDSTLRLDFNIMRTSVAMINYLKSLPLLFFIVMGNSWFWFYGATFIAQMPEFGKSVLFADESVIIFLLTLFSVGTALGSVLCKRLTKNQVSLRLLPISIAGLSLFALLLFAALASLNIDAPSQGYYGVGDLLGNVSSWLVFVPLFLLGFSAGMYIVPLYAMMQAYAPISHRARIIGANNIFNAIFMVASALMAIALLGLFKISIAQLFLVTALLNAVFGVFLYRKLKHYEHSMPMVKGNLPI